MNRSRLRRLLLPVSAERESDAVAALASELETLGVQQDDADKWISSELESWNNRGIASQAFQSAVQAVLQSAADETRWRISPYYFGLHEKLISSTYAISWAEARELLSHVRLIADLALSHGMTAARIARVLALESEQAPRYSRALDPILGALGSKRELEVAEVNAVLSDDRLRSISLFADSGIAEAATRIESLAELVGVHERLGPMMKALANDDAKPFGPYLQMLHFLLVTTEYFDHFLRESYEFRPRGTVAEFLFGIHPVALKSGNPFLNNAKKVRVLNEVWAEGADEHLAAARALAALLEVLDGLAYPARRELAALIRAWLAKVFDTFADSAVDLPEVISAEELGRLLDHVASEQSRTGGIVEQRLVDMCSVALHPSPRWLHVGVGDSVNSTNASGRKLGDVEVLDSQSASVIAYESHGGAMGPSYVAEHLRTLDKTLAARESDLLSRAPARDWSLSVVFIAHKFAGELPDTRTFMGDDAWTVRLEYVTFSQMRQQTMATCGRDKLAQLFSVHCLPALRSPRTPNRVRERVREIVAIA